MQKHIKRAERKEQVLEALKTRGKLGTSTYKLSKMLGMTNSKHFRDLVCEMRNEGLIAGCRYRLPNGKDAFLWWQMPQDVPLQTTLMFEANAA